MGLGGYEGIHPDDKGNIYIIEDIGGVSNATTKARQPNSFVYRFLPNDPSRIEKGGQFQALRVLIDGVPLVFNASDPDGDIMSTAQLKLHTPGTSYPVNWVTIHTSKEGDTAAFDANAAAKAAGATPFKRPENMAWLPGSDFRTLFFAPTGDTNNLAGGVPELAARGAFGSIFRVDLQPSKSEGRISIFVLGDPKHNSFDNLAMADEKTLLAAEDRGDTLHTQLNTLDSVWAFRFKTGDPVPFPLAPFNERTPQSGPLHRAGPGCDGVGSGRGQQADRPFRLEWQREQGRLAWDRREPRRRARLLHEPARRQ